MCMCKTGGCIMAGEFYLLNALWIGAALFIIASIIPYVWRVVWFVIIMLTPFGIVAAYQTYRDIRDKFNALDATPTPPVNVTPIKAGKPKK